MRRIGIRVVGLALLALNGCQSTPPRPEAESSTPNPMTLFVVADDAAGHIAASPSFRAKITLSAATHMFHKFGRVVATEHDPSWPTVTTEQEALAWIVHITSLGFKHFLVANFMPTRRVSKIASSQAGAFSYEEDEHQVYCQVIRIDDMQDLAISDVYSVESQLPFATRLWNQTRTAQLSGATGKIGIEEYTKAIANSCEQAIRRAERTSYKGYTGVAGGSGDGRLGTYNETTQTYNNSAAEIVGPGGQGVRSANRSITPNAYGLGIHMNRYGQPVTLTPEGGGAPGERLNITPDAYGPGLHMDQYGRPVREQPWP